MPLIAQLGNAESIFPHLLARAWQRRGVDSVIVSSAASRRLPPEVSDAPIVDVSFGRTAIGRTARRAARTVVTPISVWRARRHAAEFERRTGLAAPQAWEATIFQHVVNSGRAARAARRLRPDIVFGHEVVAYGLAVARCEGVPRVLFPWGADVMSTAEVSPWHFRLVRHALRAADLIVPSSTTAARHITRRFGIDAARVQAISWGVDLERFMPASPDERRAVSAAWGIREDAEIVMNVRRFLPLYNCDTAVNAFLKVAKERPKVHFVLLAGLDTDAYIDAARARVAAVGDGIPERFTFMRSNISMEECRALMSIADVSVSLCGRGDMRSKSVLEAAAAGAALVVSDTEEYSEMVRAGFGARLVAPADPTGVAAHVRSLLESPQERLGLRERNTRFLAAYEDGERQMDRLLEAVLAAGRGRT